MNKAALLRELKLGWKKITRSSSWRPRRFMRLVYRLRYHWFTPNKLIEVKTMKAADYYDMDYVLVETVFQLFMNFLRNEHGESKLASFEYFEKNPSTNKLGITPLEKEYLQLSKAERKKRHEEFVHRAILEHLDWEISLGEPQFDKWGNDVSLPSQAENARIKKEIYLYLIERKKHIDPWDDPSIWQNVKNDWYQATQNESGHWKFSLSPEFNEAADRADAISTKQYEADTEMAKKILEIRRCLWT